MDSQKIYLCVHSYSVAGWSRWLGWLNCDEMGTSNGCLGHYVLVLLVALCISFVVKVRWSQKIRLLCTIAGVPWRDGRYQSAGGSGQDGGWMDFNGWNRILMGVLLCLFSSMVVT